MTGGTNVMMLHHASASLSSICKAKFSAFAARRIQRAPERRRALRAMRHPVMARTAGFPVDDSSRPVRWTTRPGSCPPSHIWVEKASPGAVMHDDAVKFERPAADREAQMEAFQPALRQPLMTLGTPLSPAAVKVMLLGSGELGKEVVIELQRLGVETIAVDRYANAPAHQVAHRSHVIDMTDAKALRALVEKERPHFLVPEIEALATDELVRIEADGLCTVIPTARAAHITMNRERIRVLAAEELKLPTSPYAFASSLEELQAAAAQDRLSLLRETGDVVVGQGPVAPEVRRTMSRRPGKRR